LVADLAANLTADLLSHSRADGIANDGHDCTNGTADSTTRRLAACRAYRFASSAAHL
jgi:hypothetical protein